MPSSRVYLKAKLRRNLLHRGQLQTCGERLARLFECGYSKKCLKRAYNRALGKSRDSLLFIKTSAKPYRNVNVIKLYITTWADPWPLCKHWWLLQMDSKLTAFISKTSGITYRRAPLLRDQLVRSHYSSIGCELCCPITGTFICGSCNICRYLSSNVMVPSRINKPWKCHHFVNWHSRGGISRTVQLWQILHWKDDEIPEDSYPEAYLGSKNLLPALPDRGHRAFGHVYKQIKMLFTALDCVHPHARGGDQDSPTRGTMNS